MISSARPTNSASSSIRICASKMAASSAPRDLQHAIADVLQLLRATVRGRACEGRDLARRRDPGGIGKRIASVRSVRMTARPTATPGETPMPVRRSTCLLQTRCPPARRARSMASCSSGPSALIVIVVPRAAASSRMPMMLLPSIDAAVARHPNLRAVSARQMDELARRRARAAPGGFVSLTSSSATAPSGRAVGCRLCASARARASTCSSPFSRSRRPRSHCGRVPAASARLGQVCCSRRLAALISIGRLTPVTTSTFRAPGT